MSQFFRHGLIAALLSTVAACAEPVPQTATCGADALGVSRVLTVTADAPSPETLLAQNEIILTFDDGPHRNRTMAVMAELDKACTKATFFLLGRASQSSPDIVREIAARGHTIGSHSWSHADYTKLDPKAAHADALRAKAVIDEALADGSSTRLFRFPFIRFDEALKADLRGAGLIDVTVTVDGADWTQASSEEITDQIMEQLESRERRGIVLLHDPFVQSVENTRLLLQKLQKEGYEVVALEPPAEE